MYIPRDNRLDDTDEVWRFVDANSFALLISQVAGRPWATHIPILTAARPDGTRYLHGHIAKGNPQWRHWHEDEEVLAVFSGPHAYVSSSWYDHVNVPTWNYLAVHVYAKLRIVEGEVLYASIKSLMQKYEAASRNPVSMEGLPPDYVRREMRGVVGFELDITEVQPKAKLSQNRDDHNHALIVGELERRNQGFDADIATEMKKEETVSSFHLLRPLDRYVLSEWTKIFVSTSLGFPFILTVFDLAQNLDKYLNRHLSAKAIALSYVYWIPDSTFMAVPAAVLFATVFAIGAMTRHSEIDAAKASGISFHRLARPIFAGAFVASAIALALGELAPKTNKTRSELLEEVKHTNSNERFNFAFASEQGRVYKASLLNVTKASLEGIEVERKGREEDDTYPTYVISAEDASYKARRGWTVRRGTLHVVPAAGRDVAFSFDSLHDRYMIETPTQLLGSPRAPADMGYRELGRFIAALERSGSSVNELRVERALKLAVPVTCLIIALFGAPLATSNQRGGAAYGIGLSLGTTIVFLILLQLTKAVGGKGVVSPEMAAWVPNAIFAVIGLVMLARVRT